MRKSLLIAALLSAAALPAFADAAPGTVAEFLVSCPAGTKFNTTCFDEIVAMNDKLNQFDPSRDSYCGPVFDDTEMDTPMFQENMVSNIAKWLNEHPETHAMSAGNGIETALRDNYSC